MALIKIFSVRRGQLYLDKFARPPCIAAAAALFEILFKDVLLLLFEFSTILMTLIGSCRQES